VVENEYLKLTYIPELGGRFFSLYDKVNKKEVFLSHDVDQAVDVQFRG